MKPWKFSDGTVVHLGGDVEGGTQFAQELRTLVSSPKTLVPVWPIPSEGLALDVNDAAILDCFLRHEVSRGTRSWMLLELVDAPEVPDLPPPPWGDEEPDFPEGDLILY